MPRIIACSNIKGGEGKTTLARHLAHYAEGLNLKTLAIDLDPQGDLSISLLPDDANPKATPSAALFAEDFDPGKAVVVQVSPSLFLLPSTDALDEVGDLEERASLVKRARDAIRKLAMGYDVVVIDTPTNAPVCYKSGMAAANATVSPLQLDTYGMRGARKFMRASSSVKSNFNPTLKHIGFVVNRFNSRSKSHQQLLEELQAAGLQLLPTILRERVAVQDALDRQMPVWSGPRGTVNRHAAKEFRDMCEAVFKAAGITTTAAAA